MTSPNTQFEHWEFQHDAENIVWLGCDRKGETSNSLSIDVITELGEVLNVVESLNAAGLVLYSAKSDSFILGADIREFDQFDRAEDVSDLISQGHAVFSRLESLPCHTVAAIHGFALGGGLELALCCDYILALNVDDTRVGFPEVKLGIFPGLGGTTRLTERVGGLAGMQLMLTGRLLRVSAARGMGIVDELVDEFSSLRWAARRAVVQQRKRRRLSFVAALTNRQPVRSVIAGILRKKTAEKANPEHYPAPFAMIDLWASARDSRQRMFEGEAERVGQLMVGNTARNLRRLFFLTERLKGLGKSEDFPVRRVHVVGAGVMGGDIAAWCVVQGLQVTLQDRELKYIEPALQRAKALFKKRLKTRSAINAAVSRLTADVGGEGVSRADVIIEAIYEDADAKRSLYAEIEPKMAEHAVLATNTSALPLEELARDLSSPERLIGLHFFNPVAKMPLVEVIHSEHTDQQWITRGCAFCTHINRYPLPTRSSPGFLVNRVLAPYLMEAFNVMQEGVDKHTIDAAAVRFGMPMGPVELADVVGLDVCIKVAETLATGDVESQRSLLQSKIDSGDLGKKTGKGFYQWTKGQAQRKSVEADDSTLEQIGQRLIAPLLDECRAASADGIVADDDLLDAGIVFGTGFAPFEGGPLHYLKTQAAMEQAS
ncbi:MAG: enoyl-CoA hydratase/isomerase family protein [Granulosicoccus sp.]|nr:enoyl-CoA hydratase/isomerase family protein [Granulosicoccus sp.]